MNAECMQVCYVDYDFKGQLLNVRLLFRRRKSLALIMQNGEKEEKDVNIIMFVYHLRFICMFCTLNPAET